MLTATFFIVFLLKTASDVLSRKFTGRPENQLSRGLPKMHDGQNPNCGLAGTTSRYLALSADPTPRVCVNKNLQIALRRPLNKLMAKTTNPTTSSKWIKPPPTCKLKPRSHKIRSTTQIVQSIVTSLCSLRARPQSFLINSRTYQASMKLRPTVFFIHNGNTVQECSSRALGAG
jgi:hypothetical protein